MQADAAYVMYKEPTIPAEVRAYRPEIDPAELLEGVTLSKLHSLFKAIMKRQNDRIDPIRSTFGTLEKDVIIGCGIAVLTGMFLHFTRKKKHLLHLEEKMNDSKNVKGDS